MQYVTAIPVDYSATYGMLIKLLATATILSVVYGILRSSAAGYIVGLLSALVSLVLVISSSSQVKPTYVRTEASLIRSLDIIGEEGPMEVRRITRSLYVSYKTPDGVVALLARPGAAYPEKAILYKVVPPKSNKTP